MKQFTQEGMFNELSKVTRAINNKNISKYDLPVYRIGGEDPVKPVDSDKDYLIRMANSPLFVERYARMVGKPIDQVGEEAEAYRQQILNNIETVKINDVGVYPDKVTKRKQSESIKGAYYPPVKIENEEIEEIQKNINEAPEFRRKHLQNNFDKTLAKLRAHDHNLFMYDDNPWIKTHELSHASVKGNINDKNVNTYPFKEFSDFPELGKYYEGRKEYLTSPDEQKARVDVGRKYLENKGLYDPVNEPFTKKHYDLLQWENVKSAFDKNKEMPYDIDEIMSPYDEETTIKMFNDFVSNDSNQSYDKAQYGGLTKFPDGGEQRDGKYTYSGKNYKKIDGKWYIEPVENSGKYKLIEKGDVKSRISELEKNAQGYRETKSEKTPNYFDKNKHFTPVFKDYGPQSAGSADWLWTLPIAGPAALEAAGSLGAMQLPGLSGVSGATLGNAANAGFIAHGITQSPKTIKAWDDVAKGKKKWQDAVLETGVNLSEFIGLGSGANSVVQDITQGLKAASNYGKDLAYASKEAKSFKLPTYQPVTRWDPEHVPYSLQQAGRDLTPEQQALTGSWYSYKPKGAVDYEHTIGFYPTNRPGPGTLKHLRLSEREIANLENSMSDAAKGMSGKSESVTTSTDYLKGELNLPQYLRNKTKSIEFDVNPSEYIPQSYSTEPRSNFGIAQTGQHIVDVLKSHYPNFAGVPRQYLPFQYGGAFEKEYAEGGENPGKGLRGNPWLYTYMQESNNHEPGQVLGLGANFQHKSGLHGEANVELPFFNKNARGTATSTLGFEKGYKNFYGNASLLNSINPEENPGSFFNPKLGTTLGYQKDLGDHYSFGIEGTNMMKPGQLLDPGVRAIFKYRFEDGGGTEYTYSDRPDSRYKKINNQWYINNNTTGGKFVVINDPTGERTKILNTKATPVNSFQSAPIVNNVLLNKGKSAKEFYVQQNQFSPQISKNELAATYKEQLRQDALNEKIAEQKRRANALIPKGPVGDNTRTVVANNAVQDFNNTTELNKLKAEEARFAKPKITQAEFEKEAWEDYDKLSTGEKVLDRIQAGMVDPFGMISRAVTGEQAYIPGMGRGLLNHDSDYYENYLNSVGYNLGEVEAYDIGNFINPMHWGASAGNQFHKGNIGQGTIETALAVAPFLPKGMASLSNVKYGARLLGDDVARISEGLSNNISKGYNSAKGVVGNYTMPVAVTDFYRTAKDVLTPGSIKKHKNSLENLWNERQLIHDDANIKNAAWRDLEGQIQQAEWKLRNLKANKDIIGQSNTEAYALKQELDKLNKLKESLVESTDGKFVFNENSRAVYENMGTMKSKLDNDVPFYDFNTGEQVPIDIQTPKRLTVLELENGKPVKKMINDQDSYSFNDAYGQTQTGNIEFVKDVLPGAKPYGSSTFHNIGVAHASNDIDVAMTASDWNKVKGKVNVSQSKQAKYGPTVNIGEQFGPQGNIDVNLINENATTGMAEGDFATELYRQFFPDEFYEQTQDLINQGIKNPKTLSSNLPEIKINKTAQELLSVYDPEVKSILDAYEITPQARNKYLGTKEKQINRIDYILENATDYEKVTKAQDLFAKSIVGSKGSVGQQFSESQLSNLSENLNILKKLGLDLKSEQDVLKIATEPKRMQLFLNDFYINKSIYTREIKIDPDYIKTPEDLIKAYTEWKGNGASMMGMGTNAIELGFPKHASRLEDVTGNIYYDLTKNKIYNTAEEYVDDIISQTSGARNLNASEQEVITNLAKKNNVTFKENFVPKTLGELLDANRYIESTPGVNKTFNDDFIENINNFYKESAQALGAKAIQRGQYGDGSYATLLNDFDAEFDALTLSFNKYVPALKSRTERLTNIKTAGTTATRDLKILEQDYYKLKYYLEGGLQELKMKKAEAEKFSELFNDQLRSKAAKKVDNTNKIEILKVEEANLRNQIFDQYDVERELTKRIKQLESIKPLAISVGLTLGAGAAIVHNNGAHKRHHIDSLNDDDKEMRRKKLQKFTNSSKKQEKNLLDYNPFRGIFK